MVWSRDKSRILKPKVQKLPHRRSNTFIARKLPHSFARQSLPVQFPRVLPRKMSCACAISARRSVGRFKWPMTSSTLRNLPAHWEKPRAKTLPSKKRRIPLYSVSSARTRLRRSWPARRFTNLLFTGRRLTVCGKSQNFSYYGEHSTSRTNDSQGSTQAARHLTRRTRTGGVASKSPSHDSRWRSGNRGKARGQGRIDDTGGRARGSP